MSSVSAPSGLLLNGPDDHPLDIAPAARACDHVERSRRHSLVVDVVDIGGGRDHDEARPQRFAEGAQQIVIGAVGQSVLTEDQGKARIGQQGASLPEGGAGNRLQSPVAHRALRDVTVGFGTDD